MCLFPRHKVLVDKLTGKYVVQSYPCGKCLECQKKKQNDYVQVLYQCASRYDKLCFVTLTYNNDTLPLMIYNRDLREGEELQRFTTPNEDPEIRSFYFSGHNARDKYSPKVLDDKYLVTPSINQKHVTDWIKRMRANYHLKTGEKLDFKYVRVGEYGTRTERPHYHLMFLGIDSSVLREYTQDWNDRFGFTVVQDVDRFNATYGTHDIEAVSQYISKYMTKGIFDAPQVKDNYVQRPRVCMSKGMISISQKEIDWYRGVDFLGDKVRPVSSYTEEEMRRLYARQKMSINGKDYGLGKHYKDKIFKKVSYEVKLDKETGNWKTVRSFKGDGLQKALSRFVQMQYDALYNEKLQDFEVVKDREDFRGVVHSLQEFDEILREKRNEELYRKMKSCYQSDRF